MGLGGNWKKLYSNPSSTDILSKNSLFNSLFLTNSSKSVFNSRIIFDFVLFLKLLNEFFFDLSFDDVVKRTPFVSDSPVFELEFEKLWVFNLANNFKATCRFANFFDRPYPISVMSPSFTLHENWRLCGGPSSSPKSNSGGRREFFWVISIISPIGFEVGSGSSGMTGPFSFVLSCNVLGTLSDTPDSASALRIFSISSVMISFNLAFWVFLPFS